MKRGFRMIPSNGCFYYITDEYFNDFEDPLLMKNKEMVSGVLHNRPCFYAFKDSSTELYWMIPISSQVTKYKAYYNNKIQKKGYCDTIYFAKVLGHEKAFLIQNMCPISTEYFDNQYFDRNTNNPVRISRKDEKNIISKAKKILALQRQGKNLIFPDVINIEKQLLNKSQAK